MLKEEYAFFEKVFRVCHELIRERAMHRVNRAGTAALWAILIGLGYACIGFAFGKICKSDFRTLACASIVLPIAHDWLIWQQVRIRMETPTEDALRREVCRTIQELPEDMSTDDWATLCRLGNAVLIHDDQKIGELLKDMEAMPAFSGWKPIKLIQKAFFGR